MVNELQVFDYEEQAVRTVMIDGNPWFVGKDVAEILGYANTQDALGKHVDEEDKLTSQIATSGQRRDMTVINESGLYSLILSSKLPTAKKFKHWVTSEVLPTLSKTGSFNIGSHRKRMADFDRAMKHGKEVYTSLGYRGKKLGVALDKIYKDYLGFSALELAGIDPNYEEPEVPLPVWKRQVIDYLKENGSVTAKDLARACGLCYSTAQVNLCRMQQQGYLRKIHHGVYVLDE